MFDFGAAAQDLTKLVPAEALENAWEGIATSSDAYAKIPGRDVLTKYGGAAVTAQPMIVAAFQWQDLVTVHAAAEQAGSIGVDALVDALNDLTPKAQNDPLNIMPQVQFTKDVHENMSAGASHIYEVVPVGPVKGGLIYYRR